MKINNNLFKSEPDYTVSSERHVETAKELESFERKMGSLSINKKTYKLVRLLSKLFGRLLSPKPDLSGVSIRNEKYISRNRNDNVMNGALIVQPNQKRMSGALFLIHGGGYVVGNYKDNLGYACDTARDLGIPVISPGYSLGPEKPFPIGLDDLHSAWYWLQREAPSMDIDPKKIIIGGISAGGGMAAALVHRLFDEDAYKPSAQLLIYPMLDDRVAANRKLDSVSHKVWNNESNLFGWKSYLGKEPGGPVQPYSVPGRRENLKGLPPTWIGVGTADLFLDEDREYAKKLKESNVDVTYIEVTGAIHAFDRAETQMGIDFIKLQKDFIKLHAS